METSVITPNGRILGTSKERIDLNHEGPIRLDANFRTVTLSFIKLTRNENEGGSGRDHAQDEGRRNDNWSKIDNQEVWTGIINYQTLALNLDEHRQD